MGRKVGRRKKSERRKKVERRSKVGRGKKVERRKKVENMRTFCVFVLIFIVSADASSSPDRQLAEAKRTLRRDLMSVETERRDANHAETEDRRNSLQLTDLQPTSRNDERLPRNELKNRELLSQKRSFWKKMKKHLKKLGKSVLKGAKKLTEAAVNTAVSIGGNALQDKLG